jgi:hypothetical protein
MTDVIAWPPVGLSGWEITEVTPVSRSVGLIQGGRRTSSFERTRRYATAIVLGRGQDQAGAGYVEMLKRQLAGGANLVRVDCTSCIWQLARAETRFRRQALNWTAGGVTLNWTAGGTDVLWGSSGYALAGEPTTDSGWPAIEVAGFPAGQVVARPSERLTVTDGSATDAATVLTVARSDAAGVATIRLDQAVTTTGVVSLGVTESIVFEALSMPREVQKVAGTWAFTWEFREAFEDESADGWSEVDPWG